MTNKNQNIRNSIWNIVDVVLYPVIFLAVLPFFSSRLGDQFFGVWMLLNSLLVAFQVFNFGLSTSTVKFVALFKYRNQPQRLKIIINTNLTVSIILFVLSTLLGAVISWGVKANDLFDLPSQLKDTAATAIQLTCIIIGLKFIEQIFLNAFKGLNRFDTYALINGIIRFGTLSINLIQLYFYQSLIMMLIINLLITVIMLFIQFFLLKKNISGFEINFFLRKKFLMETGQFGLLMWLQTVIVIMVLQIDKYVIITRWGLEAFGHYAIAATIFVNIHTVLSACLTWLIPKLVRYRDQAEKSRGLYLVMRAFITMLGITALSIFYLVHVPLFNIWIGPEKFDKIREYIRLFTIFEFSYLLIIAPPLYLNYSGQIKTGTIIIYLISLLNIAGILSGYFLYNSINGIIYGLIFSTIIANIAVYAIMNSLIVHRNLFWELLIFLGISICASIFVLTGNFIAQLSILIAILFFLYLTFVKRDRFSLTTLFE